MKAERGAVLHVPVVGQWLPDEQSEWLYAVPVSILQWESDRLP